MLSALLISLFLSVETDCALCVDAGWNFEGRNDGASDNDVEIVEDDLHRMKLDPDSPQVRGGHVGHATLKERITWFCDVVRSRCNEMARHPK